MKNLGALPGPYAIVAACVGCSWFGWCSARASAVTMTTSAIRASRAPAGEGTSASWGATTMVAARFARASSIARLAAKTAAARSARTPKSATPAAATIAISAVTTRWAAPPCATSAANSIATTWIAARCARGAAAPSIVTTTRAATSNAPGAVAWGAARRAAAVSRASARPRRASAPTAVRRAATA